MRAPRESGGVDTRLDACPRQRRQCRAGRPVAASVVRPDRLARGDRHIGKRRCAARVADVVEVAVRRRQPRRPCRPDAAQRRDVAAIRRSRDEPGAGAGAVRRRRTAARSGRGGGDRWRRALHVGLPHRDILLSGPCRLRRRVCDPHERHSRTLRHQVFRTDPGADFGLRAALRARCAHGSRGSAGGGPRRRISRHPPDHPRASSALHLRALRRSLCRFGDLLRRRRLALQDADLQGRRSGRASLPAGIACGRRNATAPPRSKATADRAARAGIAVVRLLRTGPASVRHRISRPGRPLGLHGLFADPFPARRRTGLWQFAALPAPQPRAAPN